jgi:hypothetical protein
VISYEDGSSILEDLKSVEFKWEAYGYQFDF